ncbi:MAG: LPS export ABC transporter periplasmic protein LptC [Legionella sp.]
MNTGRQAVWLLLTLIALACSGWYFASSKETIILDDKTLANTTDIIANNLTVRQFDVHGQLTHYLYSPLMRHTPLNNKNWFQKPHVVIKQSESSIWEIEANKATSIHGGHEIVFENNVIIHQQSNPHGQASTLYTDNISYFPKKKFAKTAKKIVIEQEKNRITAIGMHAHLEKQSVKLLSHITGSYEPSTK